MIVRSITSLAGTEQHVYWGNGTSTRLLVSSDNVGYTMTETLVNPGSSSFLEYKNHLESCLCISGKGEVLNRTTNETYIIEPGTLYCLDNHEPHELIAGEEGLRLICVFNPALNGDEKHNLEGSGSSSY